MGSICIRDTGYGTTSEDYDPDHHVVVNTNPEAGVTEPPSGSSQALPTDTSLVAMRKPDNQRYINYPCPKQD